ncbi:MAG TPA: PQQ-dependent sugar dehydrogenase [Terriglobales bacterium]|nr:PQQ-dependent sugar dehydrogenase [Terriglobales bacterium]
MNLSMLVAIQHRMRKSAPLLLLLLAITACSNGNGGSEQGSNAAPPAPAPSSVAGSELPRLRLPEGFRISVFAEAPEARMMTWTPGGVLLVAESGEGAVVALPDPQRTGRATRAVNVLTGQRRPHGLAFHDGKLFVANENQVLRYDWNESQLRASNPQRLADLPSGRGHSTRTLVFGNGKLYVSSGSSCNVCVEKDPARAAVLEMNPDGSASRVFARGLRNAVGLVWNDRTGTVWASENGTDNLGDDLPPEEINDLGKTGGDFGWPYCYGNRVPDRKFGGDENRCQSTIPAKVEMQAHSAPLGLAINNGNMFPVDYRGDMFVAFHGSWNRSIPTGYKVVRIHLNANGEPESGAQDFITGWLPPGARNNDDVSGRPVGVLFGPDGAMYVSDDGAGLIYRVTYGK